MGILGQEKLREERVLNIIQQTSLISFCFVFLVSEEKLLWLLHEMKEGNAAKYNIYWNASLK